MQIMKPMLSLRCVYDNEQYRLWNFIVNGNVDHKATFTILNPSTMDHEICEITYCVAGHMKHESQSHDMLCPCPYGPLTCDYGIQQSWFYGSRVILCTVSRPHLKWHTELLTCVCGIHRSWFYDSHFMHCFMVPFKLAIQ